jgi:hypothetical protein
MYTDAWKNKSYQGFKTWFLLVHGSKMDGALTSDGRIQFHVSLVTN